MVLHLPGDSRNHEMGIYALPWPLPAVPRGAGQGLWHWCLGALVVTPHLQHPLRMGTAEANCTSWGNCWWLGPDRGEMALWPPN